MFKKFIYEYLVVGALVIVAAAFWATGIQTPSTLQVQVSVPRSLAQDFSGPTYTNDFNINDPGQDDDWNYVSRSHLIIRWIHRGDDRYVEVNGEDVGFLRGVDMYVEGFYVPENGNTLVSATETYKFGGNTITSFTLDEFSGTHLVLSIQTSVSSDGTWSLTLTDATGTYHVTSENIGSLSPSARVHICEVLKKKRSQVSDGSKSAASLDGFIARICNPKTPPPPGTPKSSQTPSSSF